MADQQHRFIGSGPPSTTPLGIGHHYIDETNRISYMAADVAAPTDWIVDVSTEVKIRYEGTFAFDGVDFSYTVPDDADEVVVTVTDANISEAKVLHLPDMLNRSYKQFILTIVGNPQNPPSTILDTMAVTPPAGNNAIDSWGNVVTAAAFSVDIHRMDVFIVVAESINTAWSGFGYPMVNGPDLLGL